MPITADLPPLAHGLSFADLACRDGLIQLDRLFLNSLAEADPALHANLLVARATPDSLDARAEADLVVALGRELDPFIATLFGIEAEAGVLAARTHALDPIHACKRLFVQRQAVKKYADPSSFDGAGLRAGLIRAGVELFTEQRFAEQVKSWGDLKDDTNLDLALRYAAWATLTEAGREAHKGGTLFRTPARPDLAHLIPLETIERDGVTMLRLPEHDWRPRCGLSL